MPSVRLMEVCGTHTMAIARAGIKALLPEGVELLSGPGCPVCVTPPETIDAVLELAMRPDVIISTYGDMVRVPGSVPGDNLARRRALGAKVDIVYSPIDAIETAKRNPDKEIVFLGVGFETTAPGTAAAVLSAKEENVRNFSAMSMLKVCEPAIRALIASPGFNVAGFLLPGHVATIIGQKGFEYLPLPGVIGGFEPGDVVRALKDLLGMIKNGECRVMNDYERAVSYEGNLRAQAVMEECFESCTDSWRGLGSLPESGLRLKAGLEDFDAWKKFSASPKKPAGMTACRCGDVICGKIGPRECPLFGKRCVPEDPVGPCMVSSEGACAAEYKYS